MSVTANRVIALILMTIVLYIVLAIALRIVTLALPVPLLLGYLSIPLSVAIVVWKRKGIYSLLRTDSWFGASSAELDLTPKFIDNTEKREIIRMENQEQLERLLLLRSINRNLEIIRSRIGWVLFLLLLPLIVSAVGVILLFMFVATLGGF